MTTIATPVLDRDNFQSFKVGDRFKSPFYTSQVLVEFQVIETSQNRIVARQFSNLHGMIGKEAYFWVKDSGYIQNNRYR